MKFRYLVILAFVASGCSFAQFGMNSTKQCPVLNVSDPCRFTAKRRIGGVVHEFHGVEQTPRLTAFNAGSVVLWTDLSSGEKYTTRVPCVGGLVVSTLGGSEALADQCLDDVSSDDHAMQLPGDY